MSFTYQTEGTDGKATCDECGADMESNATEGHQCPQKVTYSGNTEGPTITTATSASSDAE